MATIVQPYNPWREQLALTALGNVAGNILGDLWQTHKQNEQNRKANAFRGALSENLKNFAQQANITLAQPEAPQGYNSNPWAAAFHQKYAPLTQFDIGTSQRQPTLQDISQNADNLAASKRFSMLSPELVQSVKNDFINQAETKRLQDLQNSYIDSFRNADNPAEMLRQMAMGVGQGALSDKALPSFAQWAIHQTPQYHEINLNNKIVGSVFHPYEGTDTPIAQYNVGVSPDTAATVQGSIDTAKIHTNASRDVANINAQADYAKAQASIYAQQLKNLQDQYTALQTEIANDRESLRDMDEKDANIFLDTVIAPKELKLKQLEDMMLRGYAGTGVQTQGAGTATGLNMNDTSAVGQGMNTAANMLGVKNISVSSHFNEQRTKKDGSLYGHGGIDVPMQAGSPIRMDDYGIDWTVSRVGYDPSGYGNFVEATGILYDKNGKEHQVKMLWAHMGDNTIPLQKGQKIRYGDLIGKVGNTGNSRGKNGGFHLHLETWLDGKHSDPLKFRESVWSFIQHTKSRNSQSTNQQQPQSTSQTTTKSQPQTPQQTQDREVMRDKDGTKIYQSNLDEMIREGAKQGLGPAGVKARLRQKGFVDVQTEPQPQQPFMPPPLASMPAQSSPDNFNSWRSPFGSFDIHQPILGGGISNQPLPTQTVSDDTRNQPLFTGNAADLIRNAVDGLKLTQGDATTAIPRINPQYRPYNFFPTEQLRYPDVFFGDWPIGAGYDAQQISDWINSHVNNENPFWGHSQQTQSPQKLTIRGNPVTTGANPWSYVNEQNVFPFWNFIDWIDNGSVGGYDISPQVSISAPSQRVDYNNSARNVLWNLFFNRR